QGAFGGPGAQPGQTGPLGRPSQARAGQDYQAEAYQQPGAEPSDYPQNAFGGGFGQNGFGSPGPSQDGATQAYATQQPGYGQDQCGQPGLEAPGAPGLPGYDDDGDPAAPGSGPRSGPGSSRGGGRSSQRLGGTKMVLYLSAAVVGVVAIVFLVLHLTKG